MFTSHFSNSQLLVPWRCPAQRHPPSPASFQPWPPGAQLLQNNREFMGFTVGLMGFTVKTMGFAVKKHGFYHGYRSIYRWFCSIGCKMVNFGLLIYQQLWLNNVGDRNSWRIIGSLFMMVKRGSWTGYWIKVVLVLVIVMLVQSNFANSLGMADMSGDDSQQPQAS